MRTMSLRTFGDNGASASSCAQEAPGGHGDQLVGAKSFLVEKYAAVEPERRIEIGVRSLCVSATGSMPSVFSRPSATALYGRGLSINNVPPLISCEPPVEIELVALGVAAEIVVVVEDEDAGVLAALPDRNAPRRAR